MLKRQSEDLSAKLQRTEIILSRVKEELAHYRASTGKSPHINFDKEQQLISKLKVSSKRTFLFYFDQYYLKSIANHKQVFYRKLRMTGCK